MNRIRLDNWSPHELLLAQVEPQAAPEPHVVIVGTCYGHPLKEDGAEVATGKVTSFKVVNDGCEEPPCIVVVTGTGVEYELVEPARRYLEVFPNARERIIEAWYAKHPEDRPAPVAAPAAEPANEPLALGPWPTSSVESELAAA